MGKVWNYLGYPSLQHLVTLAVSAFIAFCCYCYYDWFLRKIDHFWRNSSNEGKQLFSCQCSWLMFRSVKRGPWRLQNAWMSLTSMDFKNLDLSRLSCSIKNIFLQKQLVYFLMKIKFLWWLLSLKVDHHFLKKVEASLEMNETIIFFGVVAIIT